MKYNIKTFRQEKGWTQEKLSTKADVSRATIASLESGESKVTTTDTLVKLAKALEVQVSDIFFEDSV